MTRLLLDTTFLIDVERATTTLDAVVRDDDDVAIAAVTVAELLVGVARADTERRRRLRGDFVHDLLDVVPVIDYDTAVARSHAQLLARVYAAGRARGAHDLMIAATALATGRTLVSADVRAFRDLEGVDVRPSR